MFAGNKLANIDENRMQIADAIAFLKISHQIYSWWLIFFWTNLLLLNIIFYKADQNFLFSRISWLTPIPQV
jgi:hypothetical protein